MKRARFAKGFVVMDRYHGDMLKRYRYAFYVRVGDGYNIDEYNLDYNKDRWIGARTADDITDIPNKDYSVKFTAYGKITDASYESSLNILIYVINPDFSRMYLIGYTGDQDSKLDDNIRIGFFKFASDNCFDPVGYESEYHNIKPIKTPSFYDKYMRGRYAKAIFNRGGYYMQVHTNGKKPSTIIDTNFGRYLELGKTLLITPGSHRWVKQDLSDYIPLTEGEAIYLMLPEKSNTGVLVGYNGKYTNSDELHIFEKLYESVSVRHIILDNMGVIGELLPYNMIDITEVNSKNGSTKAIITTTVYHALKNVTFTITLPVEYDQSLLSVAKTVINNFYDYRIQYVGDMKNPL